MRRSAAPSKLQPQAKRPRFIPTFNKDRLTNQGEPNHVKGDNVSQQSSQLISDNDGPWFNGSQRVQENGHVAGMSGDVVRTSSSTRLTGGGGNHGNGDNSESMSASTTVKQSVFRPPLPDVRVSTPIQARARSHQSPFTTGNVGTPTNTDISNRGYFSVMWCKASKKKHKKWEGDAVLVTHGRSAVLYDMESKELGKATGYKATELSSLKEDETLFIGGKEIQVMSIISEENYKSGKCFMTESCPVTNTDTAAPCPPARVSSKPFVNPCREEPGSQRGSNSKSRAEKTEGCMSRFDPTAHNALVMSRPSSSHQWEYDKKELAVVDVVVDPYLSAHLRPHQREGIAFLYECLMGMRNYSGTGAILADDMGLGKTLQCIALLWTLLKQGPYGGKALIKKALIITPASLVKNWKLEFKKWLGTERLHTFAVGQDSRVEEFVKQVCPVMIISYEMFVKSAEFISSLNFDIVICDEGHRLKNTTIKTTSLIMSLPTRRRIVLTGTPIQNDLQEFYSIVEFVNPGILGSSAAFRLVYEEPIVAARQPSATTEDVEFGEKRASELARLTKLFVIRRTQDVNNKYLLPKVDIVVFCRPSPLQLSLYHKLLNSRLLRSCLSGTCNGSPHLVCIAALKKVCSHPSLIHQHALDAEMTARYTDEEDNASIYSELLPVFPEGYDPVQIAREHSGKLQALAVLLHSLYSEGPRERLVLVSNHTKTLDMLQELCVQQGYKFLRLDGQTPTAQRQGIVQRFNSPYAQEFIFLLSSKAGGVGLNLIGASRLVLYDIDWNPANDLQAMARVWRDGQKKRVYIYRLITTGSLEEKIYQRQISKQGLSGVVMDIRNKNDVQFSLEDLRDLFTLNERTLCETHDLLNCDCDIGGSTVKETTIQSSNVRACQLGASSKSCRNLTMDELMDWHHTTADPATFPPEWHLSQAGECVTCVFWNEPGVAATTTT